MSVIDGDDSHTFSKIYPSHKHIHRQVRESRSWIKCVLLTTENSILGAVNALFAFGAAMGAIAQGWIADWVGRRKALAIAAICALIGSALTAGSVTVSMLIIVRVIQGFGLGMLISLVPLYLTEVAPSHRRGMLTSLTVLSFGLGYSS